MPGNEKEGKRRKHQKRMTKIVTKAWALPNAEPFQESHHKSSAKVAYDLMTIGQHLDDGVYTSDHHGWEHFSKDLGGVYNRHIAKNGRHAKTASEHREQVTQWLGKLDSGLAKIASDYIPPVPEHHHRHGKKRKASESTIGASNKKKKHSSDKKNGEQPQTLGEREDKAMDGLVTYIEEHGGDRSQVSSFRCKATKRADGRYETCFFNSESRRFRGMVDVARFLGLVEDIKAKKNKQPRKHSKKQMTYHQCENEKKKIRRELEKLHRNYQKATKALDDFQTEQKESRYPVDDEVLMMEEKEKGAPLAVTQTSCPAARIPDIDGFPGVPSHCIPDLITIWDFLCTFSRALSLNPISLDDFAAALTFRPQEDTDSYEISPPVYLAEAHLGLLRIMLNDRSSDDWWWSTLETDDAAVAAEGDFVDADVTASTDKEQSNLPVIKVDMAALLCFEEDPVLTATWIQTLEGVRNQQNNAGAETRQAVKTALTVSANKYVKAYLKKAIHRGKGNSENFTMQAISWLVDRVKEARPDLWERNISKEKVIQQRAKVAELAAIEMEKIDDSADAVTLDDVEGDSEEEMESDDDSDDEDEADDSLEKANSDGVKLNCEPYAEDPSSIPVRTPIPQKPPPSLVDLLLPPSKPAPSSDIVSPFTWPFIAGAAACRILHRYKRKRNEVDDSVRECRELPPISIAERRCREAVAAERILSECAAKDGETSPVDKAIDHLCTGGTYLELSAVQRLCIFRLLVEATYDTERVHEVVNDNFKSRINALKALETEERRAKREAREETAAIETAAREQLALEAKEKFIREKRKEIYESNKETNEYNSEFLDDLADEDVAEFDEETKAEYEALREPKNFNRQEVNKMVARLQEEAAFGTHALNVLTLDEIRSHDERSLKKMEAELVSLGNSLESQTIDRETSKRIERLRKDIDNAKYLATTLPEVREAAIETLKDAIEDGTIKVLRAAIRAAKQAKLSGPDDETEGMFALDLLRDAALELKAAESRKRVVDAQKDLVAKRNKCFTRTEPLGRDRFRNRFWHFDPDLSGRVWVEADYILKNSSDIETEKPHDQTYVNLVTEKESIVVGEPDKEEDFMWSEASEQKAESDNYSMFCRQEYHNTGTVAALTKRNWGAHNTEKSFRALIKNLDRKGVRENELRTNLKATLEDSGLSASVEGKKDDETDGKGTDEPSDDFRTSGDEEVFQLARSAAIDASVVDRQLVGELSSAIGKRVRVREVLDSAKLPVLASYNMATVLGWKMHTEVLKEHEEENGYTHVDPESSSETAAVKKPVWRVLFDSGEEAVLHGDELVESMCRAIRWKKEDKEYREDDASFLGYRNSLGRYCGRAADAAQSATPMALARLMVKREQELYTRIKNRTYDNNWGGKSGARNAWISTMREYCFELDTVRNGLVTLESAIFELTGGFPENGDSQAQVEPRSAKHLLEIEENRFEIELESLGKQVRGLWNSPETRSIFLEIVYTSKSIGFLALAFDLLCRNCWAYLNANKIIEVKEPTAQSTRTRRMNAWQQANQSLYY